MAAQGKPNLKGIDRLDSGTSLDAVYQIGQSSILLKSKDPEIVKYLLIATILATVIYFSGGLQKADSMWKAYNGAKAGAMAEKAGEEQRGLAKTRDEMFAMSYTPSAQCMQSNKSSLAELQCKNERQIAQTNFNAKFDAKLASGWRPK